MWHAVGTFDGHMVEMWTKESVSNESGGGSDGRSTRSVMIHLRSTGRTSVDSFVDAAFGWYVDELRRVESDDARFLYELRGFDGRAHHRYPVFGRHRLTDGKTFDTLFSRQCRSLLGTVDQFLNKKGRYGVAGYQHKLGLLLHGPPGTGEYDTS